LCDYIDDVMGRGRLGHAPAARERNGRPLTTSPEHGAL